jgi:hypothetical protein
MHGSDFNLATSIFFVSHHPSKAVNLPQCCCHYLGSGVDLQRRSAKLRPIDRGQTDSWIRGVPILPWSNFPDVFLVHALGIDQTNLLVLFRQRTGQHVRWTLGKSVPKQ